MDEEISHQGIIQRVSEKTIVVGILNESACSACHAKGACSVSDVEEKEVEISRFSGEYKVGQAVIVTGKSSQGFKALFYGYVMPFLLVLITLIISTSIQDNEALSGILSLAVLIPYYSVLYFFRNSIKRSLEFEIKPVTN